MLLQTQNILIVDEEKLNIEILCGLFEKINQNNQYNLISTTTGESTLKIVENQKIDLILLNILISDMDGYEICKILKSNESTKTIPILFITENIDDESITKAYSLGVSDYITKPFRPIELLARVKINLQLQQTISQLEYFAYYDALTDIYNRRKFFELATKTLKCKEKNIYGVMIDIDNFKNVNDTYGHSVGDVVIKTVATILKDNISDDMILGRLGGEEFAIVLNLSSNENVIDLVENIRRQIEQADIKIKEKKEIVKCTVSSGIAKYNYISSLDYLLQKADESLYEAKETGRNKSILRKDNNY